MYQLFFHCFEEASARMRVAGCGIASVTARRTCDGAHGVGDLASPVVAAEAIDQGEGIGGEGVEVVGTDDRRGGVAAQPWRDDAVCLGEVLEEWDGGRRVIREAVEEEKGRPIG